MTVDLAVSPGGRPADASPIGTPGGRKNWVDKAGGLPRYIRMIAHALIRKGMTPSHAIATAVNRVRKLAAGSTNPKVKAAAMAAVAEWEAKKAKAHLSLAYGDDPDAIVVDLAQLEDADAMLLLDLAPGNYRPPYDWKHGYIPITPAAALSKAKGNKKRAGKLLRGGARPSPRMAKQLEGARKSAPKVAPKLDQHGFPERPSDPPEVELRRLNNYLAGRAGGTASDADVARWRKRKTELEARVAKAQDDENRGRGVPGELAAAKKIAAPKLDKNGFPDNGPKKPADMTAPEIVAEQERLSNYISGRAGGTATKADVDRWQVRRRELETERQKRVRDAMRSHPDRQAAAPKPARPWDKTWSQTEKDEWSGLYASGRKAYVDARNDGKSHREAMRIGADVGGVNPDAPKPDKSPVSSTGGSVSAPKGASKSTSAGDDFARQQRRDQAARGTLEPTAADITWATDEWKRRNPGKKIAGHDAAVLKLARIRAQDKTDRGLPRTSDAEVASERARVQRATSEVPRTAARLAAEKNAAPSLDATTVRRMSDDQLDNALSRLMAAGGSDSHALSLIEKEMDRRDKAKGGDPSKAAPPASAPSVEDARAADNALRASGHRIGSESFPGFAADGITADGRWQVVKNGKSGWAVDARTARNDHGWAYRARSKKEAEQWVRDRYEGGGSPKGETPGAGDTGLDDLTFKADRQSHRFTDDVVSRMSQPQLERSLGTLLSAGYDNDAPVVRKLTGALEAKDPEAAKVYRKGADRTTQDAKAALRFAHGTREQQKADYHAYVEHLAHQAEASDMVGAHALSRASRNGTVRLPDLWSMTPAQIRKHASPELLEWFSKPGNEPLPFDAWRAAHLGATDRRAVDSLRRRREQWLSEYG